MIPFKQLLLLFIFGITAICFAQNRTIDITKSNLKWTGKAAFSAYALSGKLNTKSGYLVIKDNIITDLKIIVDMTSLHHDNNTLENHLRSEDFFEVNTFENATFELSKPAKIKNGKADITGYLTIKNKPKSKVFTISINEDYSRLNFDISIDRTAYGVTFNSPSFFEKLKEDAIADEFTLNGSLEFKK